MIFQELAPGRTSLGSPIPAFRSQTNALTYVYLLAGVHGDEKEGVYVLEHLFSWLKSQREMDLPLIIVPAVNVDGLAKNKRVNAQGVDLNRNLPTKNWAPTFSKKRYFPGPAPMSAVENQFLQTLFERFPPRLAISFHSWKPLLNYNGKRAKEICLHLCPYNGYPVSDDMGYETPGSLGHYLPEKYQASVITYECPTIKMAASLEEIWRENEEGLKSLFLKNILALS